MAFHEFVFQLHTRVRHGLHTIITVVEYSGFVRVVNVTSGFYALKSFLFECVCVFLYFFFNFPSEELALAFLVSQVWWW